MKKRILSSFEAVLEFVFSDLVENIILWIGFAFIVFYIVAVFAAYAERGQ